MKILITTLASILFVATMGLSVRSHAGDASNPTPAGIAKAEMKVLSTMNSGGYTYVEYMENGTKKWLAGPETKVSVGDLVEAEGAMPMTNFKSKTLNRTFDTILFVSNIKIKGDKASAPQADAPTHEQAATAKEEPIKVEKAPGGVTVSDCFKKKGSLKNKQVTLRGKIVKLNDGIMGKTWIHLQDGTGAAGSNDLVVTAESAGDAKVGSIVTITGKLTVDKDLGSGYFFPVIVEEAKVSSKDSKKK